MSLRPRAAHARSAAPKVGIVVQAPVWRRAPGIATQLRAAIAAAGARLGEADVPAAVSPPPGCAARAELTLALSDDAAVRVLNRDWRGKDAPTNVLSFPAPRMPETEGGRVYWGDIVVAYETTAREAQEAGRPLAQHAAHLAVHGFLHLAGYDHENNADAEVMEGLERAILARIGIPDPYLP